MDKKVIFIMDVDGVLTDGTFLYSSEGKEYKSFGADDADALKLISKLGVEVVFMSADYRGMAITKKRINDMGFEVTEVMAKDRPQYIIDNYKKEDNYVIYMGDSFVDIPVFKVVDYSICPSNGFTYARKFANYVTFERHGGGHRAVADAVFQIITYILGEKIENVL